MLVSGSALALDPHKAITQYVHDVWTTEKGLPQNTITAICQTRDGYLWLGNFRGGGLVRFDGVRFTVFDKRSAPELEDYSISALLEDRQGSLWIGTGKGGLIRLKDGKFTAITTKDGLSSDEVSSICEDRAGSLWIGTAKGLDRLKDGKFTSFATKQGLSSALVSSIYEDREGSLWVGTRGRAGGLNRFRDGQFTVFMSGYGISSIHEDRAGSLWVGTFAWGLHRFRDGKFTVFTTNEGLSNDAIRSIYEDRDGNLWIGTWLGGIDLFRDGVFTSFTTKEELSDDRVDSILEDREGSLWMGTEGGLNRFKDGKFTCFTTREGLSNDVVLSIREDRAGTLWIGTADGLNRMARAEHEPRSLAKAEGPRSNRMARGEREASSQVRRVTTFTTKDGLSSNDILSIGEDREGSLWIGTFEGLRLLRDGKLTSFTKDSGLFDKVIRQILEDALGNLWMSSDTGIFRASKKELEAYAEGRVREIHCISYGNVDGMRSTEVNGTYQPSGWKTRDGRLWFPTMKGVAMIDPANILVNKLPPPVVVEEVLVDEKVLGREAGASQIVLPPGRERFEFHYTANSFVVPTRVKFRYRLDGFDTDWVDAGTERVAHYTNLAPRKYTFRVIACNDDGLWNEKSAKFAFTLLPHFWQTWWFHGLEGLGAFGLLAGALVLQRQRLDDRRVNDLRLADLDRKTEELEHARRIQLALLEGALSRRPMDRGREHAYGERSRRRLLRIPRGERSWGLRRWQAVRRDRRRHRARDGVRARGWNAEDRGREPLGKSGALRGAGGLAVPPEHRPQDLHLAARPGRVRRDRPGRHRDRRGGAGDGGHPAPVPRLGVWGRHSHSPLRYTPRLLEAHRDRYRDSDARARRPAGADDGWAHRAGERSREGVGLQRRGVGARGDLRGPDSA